jgi:hypothetical protein
MGEVVLLFSSFGSARIAESAYPAASISLFNQHKAFENSYRFYTGAPETVGA